MGSIERNARAEFFQDCAELCDESSTDKMMTNVKRMRRHFGET